MLNKFHPHITVVGLAMAITAIVLSSISLSKAGDAKLGDTAFMAKVEKGIESYIEKQMVQDATGGKDAKPVTVSIDDDPMKGDESATVTIVEFSDFECPYCARFYKDTYKKLVSEYVNKGKVKFVYRDFPLSFHNNAKTASIAANCAKEQGGDTAYFKYHDKLYENQSSLGVVNFKKWAKEFNLDSVKFDKCLNDKKQAAEVDKDFKDGQSYGVSGTPAFFVNGRKLTGAQPFSVFKTLIEEELAKVTK